MAQTAEARTKQQNAAKDCPAPFFSRETTAAVRGIALVMMFVHHFFTFPEWWGEGISYPVLAALAPVFRNPLKLCVPVFCFLTGYFYAYRKDHSVRYSLRKISDLLLAYGSVFLIFAGTASFFLHYIYTPRAFFFELFGVSLYFPTMTFGWYVAFYALSMLLLPLVARMPSKHFHIDLLLSLLVFPFLMKLLLHAVGILSLRAMLQNLMTWFPVTLVGLITARYGLFERMDHAVRKIPVWSKKGARIMLLLLAVLVIPMGRTVADHVTLLFPPLPYIGKSPSIDISLDSVYSPLFLFALSSLLGEWGSGIPRRVLEGIGKLSPLMWFLSCGFFNNCKTIFQPLLYAPRNPVLVTLWGLLLCYAAAFLLDFGLSRLIRLKNRIL
ncbi:MAG: acyltransferase [Ruminococcaceae bacterium]|nr:acyltransferase [Oscillospiraceae bacterium]